MSYLKSISKTQWVIYLLLLGVGFFGRGIFEDFTLTCPAPKECPAIIPQKPCEVCKDKVPDAIITDTECKSTIITKTLPPVVTTKTVVKVVPKIQYRDKIVHVTKECPSSPVASSGGKGDQFFNALNNLN